MIDDEEEDKQNTPGEILEKRAAAQTQENHMEPRREHLQDENHQDHGDDLAESGRDTRHDRDEDGQQDIRLDAVFVSG